MYIVMDINLNKEDYAYFENNVKELKGGVLMIYYVVQGYSKQVDEKFKTHLYPSYLTSYDLKLGGNGFGLQSGLCDALKFTDEQTASKWREKGEKVFGENKELEIIPIDSRIFGRSSLRFVVDK